MSSIDQQFVEFVIKSLVSKPDAVKVDRRIDEKGVLLELTVDPEDLGRVIGKRGATAQSLRTLLRALGTKNEARYNLKIIDNGTSFRSQPADNPQLSSEEVTIKPDSSSTNNDEPQVDSTPEAELNLNEKIVEDDSATAAVEPDATNGSDRLARTRRELEELDDLDV